MQLCKSRKIFYLNTRSLNGELLWLPHTHTHTHNALLPPLLAVVDLIGSESCRDEELIHKIHIQKCAKRDLRIWCATSFLLVSNIKLHVVGHKNVCEPSQVRTAWSIADWYTSLQMRRHMQKCDSCLILHLPYASFSRLGNKNAKSIVDSHALA